MAGHIPPLLGFRRFDLPKQLSGREDDAMLARPCVDSNGWGPGRTAWANLTHRRKWPQKQKRSDDRQVIRAKPCQGGFTGNAQRRSTSMTVASTTPSKNLLASVAAAPSVQRQKQEARNDTETPPA